MSETFGTRTATLTMLLMDPYDTPVGTLEIVISFEALVKDVVSNTWWQESTSCIIEHKTGNVVLATRRLGEKKRWTIQTILSCPRCSRPSSSLRPALSSVRVGHIGSEKRKKYGIVGAAVNAAQRIQGVSGPGEVVVSEPFYRLVADHVVLVRKFSKRLKGMPSTVELFAVSKGNRSSTQ